MRNSIAIALLAVCASFSFSANAACTFGFLSEAAEPAGPGPRDVAAGDFNHDGLDDLAIVNGAHNRISILLAQQGGTFADPAIVSTNGPAQGGIAAAHMNGDAHLDLVALGGSGTEIDVYLGDGNGGFSAVANALEVVYPDTIVTGDFDGDGDRDVAVSRNGANPAGFNLLLNDGNGLLVQKSANNVGLGPGENSVVGGITAADFDGDGKLDVAATDFSTNRVWPFFGAGDGTFTRAATPLTTTTVQYHVAYVLTSGDFNGDGYGDLAVGGRHGGAAGGLTMAVVLSNGPDRTFASAVEYGSMAGLGALDILTHDMNGDGTLDVVVGGPTLVYVFPGAGDGTFSPQQTAGSGADGIAALDADNDGGSDLAATHAGADTVGILRNICGAVTLDFTTSANPVMHRTPVTLTATITANPAATGTLTITRTGGGVVASTNVATSTTVSATPDLEVGTYEFVATYSGDSRYPAATRTITQTVQAAPFGPPPNFNAVSLTAGTVRTSWTATSNTAQYQVFWNYGAGFQFIGTTASTQFDHIDVPINEPLLYQVRAISPSSVASAFSQQDLAVSGSYLRQTLVAGMNPLAQDLWELRNIVAETRTLAGLSEVPWTDPSPFIIKAVYINELRTAINQALVALGLPARSFTDPTVTNATLIKAVHITEVRDALR